MLPKPVAECTALCIPTAQWGHPMCGPASVRGFIAGGPPWLLCDLGWASVGVLELTALPSMARSDGSRGSERPTCSWSTAATPPTCATG